MGMRVILGFGAWLLSPALGAGQSQQQEKPKAAWSSRPRVEVIASVAVGHVSRFNDRGFGTEANTGAGVEVAIWRGLRGGAEVNRTFGLSPTPAKCGFIYLAPGQPALPCTGSAREGVSAATAASVTAAYFFGISRMQPYVFGGISMLRTHQFTATYIVRTDHVELQETSSRDTGTGMTFGIGMRASVTRRLCIRPEFRSSDGSAMSRHNLSQMWLSLGLGYGW